LHSLLQTELDSLSHFLPNSNLQQLTSIIAEVGFNANCSRIADSINAVDAIVQNVVVGDTIAIAFGNSCHSDALTQLIQSLIPWKKGCFQLGSHQIQSEWKSHFKWHRFNTNIDFANKTILDIGAANGYFSLQMLQHKPKFIVAIEPWHLYFLQYCLLIKLLRQYNRHYHQLMAMLPLTFEQLLQYPIPKFDLILSMGVLYHRRSPIDHLLNINRQLTIGGQIVLETLYIEHSGRELLIPRNRYAKMPNVWFIPSELLLIDMLHRCNFSNIKVLDRNQTTAAEQCATQYCNEQSLQHFLHSQNEQLTIEGYPRPKRIVITAEKEQSINQQKQQSIANAEVSK